MTSRKSKVNHAGFSLVELLAVIAIIALLTAGTGQAISALISSGGANQNISQLSGILEQAREYAVSQNTYVWVTFYSPGAATNGVKQVSVAVVASTDGTDPAAVNGASSWQQYSYGTIPGSGLALVNKVVTLKEVSLEGAASLSSTPSTLPSSPSVQDPTNSFATNTAGFFSIPIPGTSTPAQFTQAIEFTPSGQARNSSSPVDVIDVDVQPQKGSVNDSNNVAVLRLSGLTGETAVYRH